MTQHKLADPYCNYQYQKVIVYYQYQKVIVFIPPLCSFDNDLYWIKCYKDLHIKKKT